MSVVLYLFSFSLQFQIKRLIDFWEVFLNESEIVGFMKCHKLKVIGYERMFVVKARDDVKQGLVSQMTLEIFPKIIPDESNYLTKRL